MSLLKKLVHALSQSLVRLTFLTCNWFLGTNWLLKRKMSALHIWKSFLRNNSSSVTEARAGINPSSSPWLSSRFSSVSPTGSYLAASLLQSPPWKSHGNLLGIVERVVQGLMYSTHTITSGEKKRKAEWAEIIWKIPGFLDSPHFLILSSKQASL